MRYNKIIYAALACLSMGAFSSCSGILDKAPDGKIKPEEIFSNQDRIEAYLQTIYSAMPQKGSVYYFWSRGPACWCDDAWDGDYVDVDWAASAQLYKGAASAGSFPIWDVNDQGNNSNYWSRYWYKIHDCGVLLEELATTDKIKDEADRRRFTAEAHLLRAYYYSELVKWFGTGLPIIDKPLDYRTIDQELASVKKASYFETVKFIMDDCDAAINCDEMPMRITTGTQSQRVHKALAYAIKSRMAVYAASPLYCDGENHWDWAYEITKESLNALRDYGFKLYNKMVDTDLYGGSRAYFGPDRGYPRSMKRAAGIYNEYFCNNQSDTDSPNDMETIWQLPGGGGNFGTEGIGAIGQYKCGTNPSQEIVDCFETTDGEPILDLAKPYLDEETHLQPNYNPNNTKYDPNNPYANRDPRFYADIYYNGSKRYCWWPFPETADSPENYDSKNSNNNKGGIRTRVIATWEGEKWTGTAQTGRMFTRTGYFIRKFYDPRTSSDQSRERSHHKDYRFAEMLLNFAEAAIYSGHDDEAISAINEVRKRVNMPGLPEDISHENLILRYKNERRVEFAFEEQRIFDVRRWHNPDENLATTDKWITKMSIQLKKNADGKPVDANGNVITDKTGAFVYIYTRKPAVYERHMWENKWLKFPIPLSEINRIRSLGGGDWQNPGW